MLSKIILQVLLGMFCVVEEDLPNSQMGNIFCSCGPLCIAAGLFSSITQDSVFCVMCPDCALSFLF